MPNTIAESKFSLISANVFKISDTHDFEIKRINLSDEELKELDQAIVPYIPQRIVEIDNESLNNPKVYKISNNDDDYYQRNVLDELLEYIKTNNYVPTLQSFSELFAEKKLLYSAIVYYYRSDATNNSHDRIYVYELKRSGILSNRVSLLRKKRKIDHVQGNEIMELVSIDDGFNLPISKTDSIAYYSKKQNDDNYIKTVNVFHAGKFDEIFDTFETQVKYSENVLDNFISGTLKLTTGNMHVRMSDHTNRENLLETIKSDPRILKSFSGFKGTSRSSIQKTTPEKLTEMFDYLRTRINADADIGFEEDDIPVVQDGEICLTVRSVKIFTALLENKIIERLLDKHISIPYFE